MRLIDARYIINRITEERRRWGDDYDVEQVLGDIEDAPTIDAVPVMRCKDCKWWDDNYRECGSPNWYPNQDGCVVQPAGMFCGWAERRTDG